MGRWAGGHAGHMWLGLGACYCSNSLVSVHISQFEGAQEDDIYIFSLDPGLLDRSDGAKM